MPMSTEKKWAIVTGGSRGLGFETAKGLITAGIHVYIIGQNPDRAKESAQTLGCEYRSVDVADSNKFRQVLDDINQDAFVGLFQVKLPKGVVFGYSCDYVFSDIQRVSMFSHEVSLMYSNCSPVDKSRLACPLF